MLIVNHFKDAKSVFNKLKNAYKTFLYQDDAFDSNKSLESVIVSNKIHILRVSSCSQVYHGVFPVHIDCAIVNSVIIVLAKSRFQMLPML